MAIVEIPYRFRVRRRTAASWTSLDEVLLGSEIGLESDTGKFKIGDGTTAWTSLDYAGWGLLQGAPTDGQVPTWDNANGVWVPETPGGGGGGGAVTLLGTVTVAGAAATTMTLSSLDLSAYKMLQVVFSLENATGSASTISLHYNSDSTETNYHRQLLTANNTVSGSRANNANIIGLVASTASTGTIDIIRDFDGRPRARSHTNISGASTIIMQDYAHIRDNTANVTSITLSSSVASALAIGSTFSVFGVN